MAPLVMSTGLSGEAFERSGGKRERGLLFLGAPVLTDGHLFLLTQVQQLPDGTAFLEATPPPIG